MPFYDLRCRTCSSEFNIPAAVKDKMEKNIPCPECGSRDLETVYKGAPAYIKNTAPECPNRSACGGSCPHAG